MASSGYPKLDDKYKALKDRIRSEFESAWSELANRWRNGLNECAAELAAINREVDSYCPDWNDPAWQSRALPKLVPPVVRFGKVPLELASLPGGVSNFGDLMESVPTSFSLPALRSFPTNTNLLIEAPAEARGAALEVLQASMFRCSPACRRARSDSRSSTRSASAATSARSCTWPTSTRPL